MEASEQFFHKFRKQRLGKSTGEPIDEYNNDANNNSNNNNKSANITEKKNLDTKKLAQIFNKSFFSKSIPISTPATVEQQSRENTSDNSESSSEQWQLLEPDEDMSDDEPIDGKVKISEQESPLVRAAQYQDNMTDNDDQQRGSEDVNTKTYVDIDPLSHRETLSPALIYLCTVLYALVPLASFCTFLTLVCLLFTRYWPITLVYFTYVYFDRQTCNRGGCRWQSFYASRFWSYLAAYFPIKLRHSRQFKLDPTQNYILNYHPHGIAAFGCVTSFATNGLNFSELFPGIRSRFMVHETSYYVPLMREIFSLRGDCSVNSKSIDYFLEKKWRQPEAKEATGNLLAWVGGGLAEADLSDAKVLKIVVATRKGFVKKALIHGANLIPCIAFGENSVFTKINFEPNSLLYKLESRWYNLMKFKHPIYYGRSIFGEKICGVLPYKRPITVAMGDPIKVERVAEPTQQQVDELHTRYLEHLRHLYRANSDLCTEFDHQLELV